MSETFDGPLCVHYQRCDPGAAWGRDPGVAIDAPTSDGGVNVLTPNVVRLPGGGYRMYYTQLDYPLVTGGMPLTSGWATGVVTFEFTMAGAVVGTVLMFLWESGLVHFWKRVPALPRRENTIGVRLHCPDHLAGRAADLLRASGAASVEEIAESS